MAKSTPNSPTKQNDLTGRVAIVASRYNSEYTDALVQSAMETLSKLAPHITIEVIRVPGAFEIPVVVETLAGYRRPQAIIALGVIIRGSTAHADLIAQSITNSLQDTAADNNIPVIHEVLLVDNSEQAEARTLGDELNRGREAAEAAIDMIRVMEQFTEIYDIPF